MVHPDWLQAFIAFAEHLNFTRAARALHLSQPALHEQVRRLGETLRVPLYQRQGRSLRLTADGQRVLAFARELRERTEVFLSELRAERGQHPVVLAAGEGTYLYLLGQALRQFTARRHGPLRLLTRDREGTLAAVRSGEAHLGVAPVDVRPDGLTVSPLATFGQLLVVPDTHPCAPRRSLPLAEAAQLSLVLPPPDRPQRMALEAAARAAGVTLQVAVEATGWELALHFVALGLGAAIVNACCRIPPGLVAVPIPDLPQVRYHLIERTGARPGPGAVALRALLKERVGVPR